MKPEKIRESFHTVAGVLASIHPVGAQPSADFEAKLDAFRQWGSDFAEYVGAQNERIEALEKIVAEHGNEIDAIGDGIDELTEAVSGAKSTGTPAASAPAATAAPIATAPAASGLSVTDPSVTGATADEVAAGATITVGPIAAVADAAPATSGQAAVDQPSGTLAAMAGADTGEAASAIEASAAAPAEATAPASTAS